MPSLIHVLLLLAVTYLLFRYETRKSRYQREDYDVMAAVTKASIEASLLTTFITQPIWVLKTRMLLNVNKNIS
jgi:hypothetical protein